MRKAGLLAIAVVVLVFAFSGVALAASPQDIYDDFAANGQLNGTYTDAELQAFLDSAATDVYGDPQIIADLTVLITNMLNEDDDRDTFPFTGFQLLFAGLGAAALIGGGVGMRRVVRSRG